MAGPAASQATRLRDGPLLVPASELADKADFRFEMLAVLIGDASLDFGNQRPDLGSRGRTEVDHDVRVQVRNLRVTHTEAFQPALIDQAAGSDILDLLEDRTGTRVDVEPRMA